MYCDIALDAAGNPHISHQDGEKLKYAWWDPDANPPQWVIETVDSERWVGFWTSIVIDAAGGVHISHEAGQTRRLRYAHKIPISQ